MRLYRIHKAIWIARHAIARWLIEHIVSRISAKAVVDLSYDIVNLRELRNQTSSSSIITKDI